jgi:hypothetical protein
MKSQLGGRGRALDAVMETDENTYSGAENRLRKKAKSGQEQQSEGTTPTHPMTSTDNSERQQHGGNGAPCSQAPRCSGRWDAKEKLLFLYGLSKFGKGRWKKISVYVPDRYVCRQS